VDARRKKKKPLYGAVAGDWEKSSRLPNIHIPGKMPDNSKHTNLPAKSSGDGNSRFAWTHEKAEEYRDYRVDGHSQREACHLIGATPRGLRKRKQKTDAIGTFLAEVDEQARLEAELNRALRRDEAKKTVRKQKVRQGDVADIFAAHHAETLRYDHQRQKWFVFRSGKWEPDRTDHVLTLIRAIAPEQSVRFLRASLEMARAEGGPFAVTSEIWDSNPDLVGCPDGNVIDLTDGTTRAARPEDYLTQSLGVTPEKYSIDTRPKLWGQCLIEWTLTRESEFREYDPDTISFLQEFFGSCLQGGVRHHIVPFLEGPGGNGKSVLLTVMQKIFGDYARIANHDLFLFRRFGPEHPTEIADLAGARILIGNEMPPGGSFDLKKFKSLTGGDRQKARRMRQDYFEYTPTFQTIIGANHIPRLAILDDAMRRRLRIVPFDFRPDDPNPNLVDELMQEAPKILGWTLLGYHRWRTRGFTTSTRIQRSTSGYFSDQDTVLEWLEKGPRDSEDVAYIDMTIRQSGKTLYSSFKAFCIKNKRHFGGRRAFYAGLTDTQRLGPLAFVKFPDPKSGPEFQQREH